MFNKDSAGSVERTLTRHSSSLLGCYCRQKTLDYSAAIILHVRKYPDLLGTVLLHLSDTLHDSQREFDARQQKLGLR